MLDDFLQEKLSLKLNQFKFSSHGIERFGYWATLSEEFSMAAVVQENWRFAHERNTRLFVGSSRIRDQFVQLVSPVPKRVIYVVPGLSVIEVCEIANCGSAYTESVNFKERLRQVLLQILESWAFEILAANEIVLTIQLVGKPDRNDAKRIEDLVMGIAPFSGDIDETPRIRDSIRKNGRFNVRMSVL